MIIEIILCRKKKKKMLGLLWHKISSHAHFKYEEAIDLRLGLVTWLIDISTLTLDLTGKIRKQSTRNFDFRQSCSQDNLP